MMDAFGLTQAQEQIENLQRCADIRCVYDHFNTDLTKNSREDIYLIIKDNKPGKIDSSCSLQEQPPKMSPSEKCFILKFNLKQNIAVVWKFQNGSWKISNAAKRPFVNK